MQLAHPLLKAAGKSSVVMISSVAGGPSTVQSGTIYAMLKGVPILAAHASAWFPCISTVPWVWFSQHVPPAQAQTLRGWSVMSCRVSFQHMG